MFSKRITLGMAATLFGFSGIAQAAGIIRITEYSSGQQSTTDEFIELTNVGDATISLTGWTYDDGTAATGPGAFSIGAFGDVLPGESVIISEVSATAFRTLWSLGSSVKVVGGSDQNLSSTADQINIYNGATRIDFVGYTATTTGAGASRNFPVASLGSNDASMTVVSSVGDSFGSYTTTSGANTLTGNPGKYLVAVPEPTSLGLLGVAGLLAMRRRRA